ncbi:MAG: hypothetical protein RLZ72_238, partial [Actinomycetota bacterium]
MWKKPSVDCGRGRPTATWLNAFRSAILDRLSNGQRLEAIPSCCRKSVAAESRGGGLFMHPYELMVILNPEVDD